jgi:hypothetical protein
LIMRLDANQAPNIGLLALKTFTMVSSQTSKVVIKIDFSM